MPEIREYKATVEARANPETGRPMITGYGIVFNSESENLGGFVETVDPGAVVKTLSEGDIRALANHDSNQLLGRVKAGTLRLSTDSRGVRYEIDVNPDDPGAQAIYARVLRGDMDGSSFCFETLEESWNWETQPAQRRLLEIKLIELGPVVFPAYSESTAQARAKDALKRIASKLGHPVERMAEALRSGEIRSLIDTNHAEAIASIDEESSELAVTAEERVGKTISAATMAKLRAIQEQLNAIMGEAEPEEPDADTNDDYMRALTTESMTGEQPDDEQETPEDADPVAAYRARLSLRKHSVSDLFAKYEIASVAEDTL